MRSSTFTSILVVLALLAPAVLAVTSATRDVRRVVASPLDAAPDASHWRVDVPAGHAVRVRAESANATFTVSWCQGANACAQSLPSLSRDVELQAQQSGQSWIVSVDPQLGARVDIRVAFDGFLVDQGNAPGDFTLTDLPSDAGCFSDGACLP